MKTKIIRSLPLTMGIVAVILLFAMNASAARSTPVTVVNPDSAPVPVSPQTMVGVPVQVNDSFSLHVGNIGISAILYYTPTGKLLIIESFTLAVNSNGDQQGLIRLHTQLDSLIAHHNLGSLPPAVYTPLYGYDYGDFHHTLQRNLRLYTDGIVTLGFSRGTEFRDEAIGIDITMSGRLVDDPSP